MTKSSSRLSDSIVDFLANKVELDEDVVRTMEVEHPLFVRETVDDLLRKNERIGKGYEAFLRVLSYPDSEVAYGIMADYPADYGAYSICRSQPADSDRLIDPRLLMTFVAPLRSKPIAKALAKAIVENWSELRDLVYKPEPPRPRM